MRKMFSRSLALTVIALGLLGCSSEEDTIVMSPLPIVKSEFTPSTEWTASVGDGVGHFFLNCHRFMLMTKYSSLAVMAK